MGYHNKALPNLLSHMQGQVSPFDRACHHDVLTPSHTLHTWWLRQGSAAGTSTVYSLNVDVLDFALRPSFMRSHCRCWHR